MLDFSISSFEKDGREDEDAREEAGETPKQHIRMAPRKSSNIDEQLTLEGLRGVQNEVLELSGALRGPM